MYYNNISCISKILLEAMYTIFYVYYYYLISFLCGADEEEEAEIVFFCGYGNIPGEKNYWDSRTQYMGGSENSLILLSEKLSELYNVKVYNNCLYNRKINGVKYVKSKYFNYYKKYKNVIFWRFPLPLFFFNSNYNIENKILWLHDGEPICKFFEYFHKGIVNNMIISCYNRLDNIIAPSKFLYTKIVKYNTMNNTELCVIPNFVKKLEKNKIKTSSKKNKILWHINFNRGLQNILNKWKDITSVNNDFELHVYGNKEELYLNKNMYDDIDLKNVFFHSKMCHEDIIAIIPEFKFFIYPAIIRESFSISTWECLINGCIPIVYDVGAIGEIINFGGIVVPPDDFEGILNNLKDMMDNEIYFEKLNNINSFNFNFISEENILNQWIKIVDSNKISDNVRLLEDDQQFDYDISVEYKHIFDELKLSYDNYNLKKYKEKNL